MDNASDYGSEDSRFESWRARRLFSENEKLSSRLQRAVSVAGASERTGFSLLCLAALKNCQADCSALYPLPAPLNGRVSPYSA